MQLLSAELELMKRCRCESGEQGDAGSVDEAGSGTALGLVDPPLVTQLVQLAVLLHLRQSLVELRLELVAAAHRQRVLPPVHLAVDRDEVARLPLDPVAGRRALDDEHVPAARLTHQRHAALRVGHRPVVGVGRHLDPHLLVGRVLRRAEEVGRAAVSDDAVLDDVLSSQVADRRDRRQRRALRRAGVVGRAAPLQHQDVGAEVHERNGEVDRFTAIVRHRHRRCSQVSLLCTSVNHLHQRIISYYLSTPAAYLER